MNEIQSRIHDLKIIASQLNNIDKLNAGINQISEDFKKLMGNLRYLEKEATELLNNK